MKKFSKEIRRVGLIANSGKVSSRDVVRRAARLITSSGRQVLADAATDQFVGLRLSTCPDAAALARLADFILVFGGDGTMLRAAHEVGGSRTPLLGINIGALGFLTDVPSSELGAALQMIWNGEFWIEPRALIEATGGAPDRSFRSIALNEFVVTRRIVSRPIELEVTVDSQVLTRYRGDGLIVSSPTGSTAYSLAAGGAVVYPTAQVLTLTPICPHTLSNRSVIVKLSSTVTVKVISKKPETVLHADGQSESHLEAGDVITVRGSRHSVRLAHLAGSSFFDTLRRKLNWSGSNIPAR